MKCTIAAVLTAVMLGCGGDAETSDDEAPASEVAAQSNESAGDADVSMELAQCKHAPDAAIYNRPASLWQVEQPGDKRLHMTVWRMKDGGATQFNLHLSRGDQTNEINTVEGGSTVGDGTVTITEEGEGVRFDINGKDQGGNEVKGRVTCAKLVPLEAEGG